MQPPKTALVPASGAVSLQKPEMAPLAVLTSHLAVMALWKTLLAWTTLCQAHCVTQSGKTE